MKTAFAIIVFVLVISAGCSQSGEIEPRPGSGGLDYQPDGPVVSDSRFHFEGSIRFEYSTDERISYEHVMLCLFDRGGTVINSTDLWTFETPHTTANVSLRSREVPKYVVVDHPKLRDHGFVRILKWDEDRRAYATATIDDIEFEYPRTEEIGTCS